MDDCISPQVIAVAQLLIASGLAAQIARAEAAEQPRTDVYTVQEIAADMRVHESTIYRAIQDGCLKAIAVGQGGRGIRVEPAAYEAFKADRKIRGRRPAGAVA